MIYELIKQQLEIINKAKTIKGITDYDFNNLTKALMTLEKLKENKRCEDMKMEENYKKLYKDFAGDNEKYINAITYYRLFLNEMGYSDKDIFDLEKTVL